jgi:hypothetical protein
MSRKTKPAPGPGAVSFAINARTPCRRNREGGTCWEQASPLLASGYCYAHDKDARLGGRWLAQARAKGAVLGEREPAKRGRPAGHRGAPSRTSDRRAAV